jgi:hypothetical protein
VSEVELLEFFERRIVQPLGRMERKLAHLDDTMQRHLSTHEAEAQALWERLEERQRLARRERLIRLAKQAAAGVPVVVGVLAALHEAGIL